MSEAFKAFIQCCRANDLEHAEKHLATFIKDVCKPKAQKPSGYTLDFELFWGAYPKRKSKGAAFKAWLKLSVSERHAATDRAEWVAGCWEHNDPDELRRSFIQDPATWLNARGWEDDDGAVELMARGK